MLLTNHLISVIIPIYNVELYLKDCINSIICQTYTNLEIILVNDGSPDNCGAICDEYALKDARVKVIHKENGGLSDARNAGLDICTGDYISFVDSDDVVHPQFIQVMYNNLIETDSDLSICFLKRFTKKEEIKNDFINPGLKIFTKNQIFYEFYEHKYSPNIVVAWNKLYKRKLFDNIKYPKDRKHEDEFVIHHILNKCNTVVFNFVELYYYRQREGSIMSKFSVSGYYDYLQALQDRVFFCKDYGFKDFAKKTKNAKASSLIYFYTKSDYLKDIKKDILKDFSSVIIYLFKAKYFSWKERIYVLIKLIC